LHEIGTVKARNFRRSAIARASRRARLAPSFDLYGQRRRNFMEFATRESPVRPAPRSPRQLVAMLARTAIEVGLMSALLPVAMLVSVIAAQRGRPRDNEPGGPS
jgi:hypothetical protein